jgi:hypothetical protein
MPRTRPQPPELSAKVGFDKVEKTAERAFPGPDEQDDRRAKHQ